MSQPDRTPSAAQGQDKVMQAAFGGMPVESYIREAAKRPLVTSG